MTEFVVDACVLRSAGYGTSEESVGSRDFIDEVYSGRHQAFLSEKLEDEWMRHASRLALAWIASMETHGLLLRAEPNRALGVEIDRYVASLDCSYLSCAQKDVHLIKSALSFRAIIVSGEIRSRNIFCQLSMRFDALHEIRWVQPMVIIGHGLVAGVVNAYPIAWTLSHASEITKRQRKWVREH